MHAACYGLDKKRLLKNFIAYFPVGHDFPMDLLKLMPASTRRFKGWLGWERVIRSWYSHCPQYHPSPTPVLSLSFPELSLLLTLLHWVIEDKATTHGFLVQKIQVLLMLPSNEPQHNFLITLPDISLTFPGCSIFCLKQLELICTLETFCLAYLTSF